VEDEHFVRAHPARESEQLREVADPASRSGRPGRGTADLGRAGALAYETTGDLDEGRLSGAVRAEQPHELPFGDLEVDAAERRDGAVALGKVADGERGGHRPSLATQRR
jgi:hypothetical protein